MYLGDIKYYNMLTDEQSYILRHDLMSPSEEFPPHSHPQWELAYVVCGSGMAFVGGESRPFVSGEITLIPPDMPHGWNFGSEDRDSENRVEDICLTFRRELFAGLAALMPELAALNWLSRTQTALRLHGEILETMKKLMSAMLLMDELERFAQTMLIIRLLASADELNPTGRLVPPKKSDEKMQCLDAYIRLHFNHDIPIDTVAGLVHMNRSSFCVFFRRMKSISFSTYLNSYRVDTACRLLLTTDRPVSEIAYNVGFNSQAHFCRTFRKFKQTSPLNFRASAT